MLNRRNFLSGCFGSVAAFLGALSLPKTVEAKRIYPESATLVSEPVSLGWAEPYTGTEMLRVAPDCSYPCSYAYVFHIPSKVLIKWANLTESTPLRDLREMQMEDMRNNLHHTFNANAEIDLPYWSWMDMARNTNPNDLGGRRSLFDCHSCRNRVGAFTSFSIEQLNLILAAEDLPQVNVVPEDYRSDKDSLTTVTYVDGNGREMPLNPTLYALEVKRLHGL